MAMSSQPCVDLTQLCIGLYCEMNMHVINIDCKDHFYSNLCVASLLLASLLLNFVLLLMCYRRRRGGTKVIAIAVARPDTLKEIRYLEMKPIWKGSFGTVCQAKLCDTNTQVAIKKVLLDKQKQFRNRELRIMRRLEHCNIVKLMYFFYSSGDKTDEVYLNLVLEFIPETLDNVALHYSKNKQTIPVTYIKLYMYQLFRSLAYIHSVGICHRDINPKNLLIDQTTGVLKLCDFGSAMLLAQGQPNVRYMCSLTYLAPELIFGAIDNSTKIDVWSAGCVLAELLLGEPIFPGVSVVGQLVEIINVLGTPTLQQIREMNPNYDYTQFRCPRITAYPWSTVFRPHNPPEAIELVARILKYTPSLRITCLEACAHTFFDELREPTTKLPNGRDLPPLFNFTEQELSIQRHLNGVLIPGRARGGNGGGDAGLGSDPVAGGVEAPVVFQ